MKRPTASADPKELTRGQKIVRRGIPFLAATAIIGTPIVANFVEYVQTSLGQGVAEQNAIAGARVHSYKSGTLQLHPGVRTYAAPDTKGRHDVGAGEYVDGNEVPSDDVGVNRAIANPVEYNDPDGTQWLGFTGSNGEKAWIKMGVIGQTDPEGKPYAEWLGNDNNPASVPSVVLNEGVFVDPSQPPKDGHPFRLGVEIAGT